MSVPRSQTQSATVTSRRVRQAAVVTHGRPERIGDALTRLRAVAKRCDVALVDDPAPDMAIVLGGDGTTLRALNRYLGTTTACLGVNFGRVGFLTSIDGAELEAGSGARVRRRVRRRGVAHPDRHGWRGDVYRDQRRGADQWRCWGGW